MMNLRYLWDVQIEMSKTLLDIQIYNIRQSFRLNINLNIIILKWLMTGEMNYICIVSKIRGYKTDLEKKKVCRRRFAEEKGLKRGWMSKW